MASLKERIAEQLLQNVQNDAEYINWILDGDDISWEIANNEVKKVPLRWAGQILAEFRTEIDKAGLTPEQIESLMNKWAREYEDVPMTDAEWETKRLSLLAQAQLDAIKKVLE